MHAFRIYKKEPNKHQFHEAMYKTIDVIAHGRERFENGGVIAKRDVLLALGTHPTLYDGVIELTPFEWLTPIEKGLPQLQEALSMVKPQDLQIGNPALEPIRTSWLGTVYIFQTFYNIIGEVYYGRH